MKSEAFTPSITGPVRLVFQTITLFILSVLLIVSEPGGHHAAAATNESCTKTIEAWLSEPDWPVLSLTLGDKKYKMSDIRSILEQSNNDTSVALAREFVAAFLNYAAGAKPSLDLNAAQQWLIDNKTPKGLPYRSEADHSNTNTKKASELIKRLAKYNNEEVPCEITSGKRDVDLVCEKYQPVADPPSLKHLALYPGYVHSSFENGLVKYLRGMAKLPGEHTDPVLDRLKRFFSENKALFGLTEVEADLRLTEEVETLPYSVDPEGVYEFTFERMINNIPVYDSHLFVRIDNGRLVSREAIRSILAKLPSRNMISNIIILDKEEAIKRAISGFKADLGLADIRPETPLSVYETLRGEPELIVFTLRGVAELIVFNVEMVGLIDVDECQSFNRLAYDVTILGPQNRKATSMTIDPGHGGILQAEALSVE